MGGILKNQWDRSWMLKWINECKHALRSSHPTLILLMFSHLQLFLWFLKRHLRKRNSPTLLKKDLSYLLFEWMILNSLKCVKQLNKAFSIYFSTEIKQPKMCFIHMEVLDFYFRSRNNPQHKLLRVLNFATKVSKFLPRNQVSFDSTDDEATCYSLLLPNHFPAFNSCESSFFGKYIWSVYTLNIRFWTVIFTCLLYLDESSALRSF